ncbi:MAG TPA: ABC transporter permease [Candidatus Limnocylindrales bacterium]|jgi:ABC-2 type transport system permease protein|nr:ABC transporter permease [Candidatus Limnocylindrales bacterium]
MSDPGAVGRLGSVSASGDPVPGRPARGWTIAEAWRGYATALRLGWAIEANWTDPLLFFTYSVAKPIAAALILVVMLDIVSGGGAPGYRAYLVTGTALWAFVQGGFSGLAMSVLEDRERYRMLKYLYVSPTAFAVSLLGRGTARIAIGGMGAVITLAFGVIALGIRFDPAQIDWPLLAVSMIVGLGAIVAFGLALAAVVLQTRQESWSYPEATAGAMFLLVGAIFPLAVLPGPVQVAGLAIPLTWWMEGVRRALFPDGVSGVGGPGSLWAMLTGSGAPDRLAILALLLVTTAAGTLAAAGAFAASERRAKDRGLIDQTTGS